MTEWYMDDSFWSDLYSHIFCDERLDSADEEAEKVLSLIQFQGESVLDLCCGPGRHAIALAQRGLTVTAVDSTEFLIRRAKEKARLENLDIEWILEDMRNFARTNSYELVLNMLTSFGYFEKKDQDLIVLKNIHKSLKQDGILVMDMVGKELLAKTFQPALAVELADGSTLFKRLEILDSWSRLRNEWLLLKNGTIKKYIFEQTIYSGQELKDRLYHVGFKKVNLYGNLNGDDYGPQGCRLVAVAFK